jgi:hypothetical protein
MAEILPKADLILIQFLWKSYNGAVEMDLTIEQI